MTHWLYTTSHKNIGLLYLAFAFFSGLICTSFGGILRTSATDVAFPLSAMMIGISIVDLHLLMLFMFTGAMFVLVLLSGSRVLFLKGLLFPLFVTALALIAAVLSWMIPVMVRGFSFWMATWHLATGGDRFVLSSIFVCSVIAALLIGILIGAYKQMTRMMWFGVAFIGLFAVGGVLGMILVSILTGHQVLCIESYRAMQSNLWILFVGCVSGVLGGGCNVMMSYGLERRRVLSPCKSLMIGISLIFGPYALSVFPYEIGIYFASWSTINSYGLLLTVLSALHLIISWSHANDELLRAYKLDKARFERSVPSRFADANIDRFYSLIARQKSACLLTSILAVALLFMPMMLVKPFII